MFQDADFQSNAFRIYTTIDMRLQRAAAEAVRLGMASVDEQIKKQRRFKGQTPPDAAGRAGGDRPAYRRGEGAGGRPQLWHEPAQSRAAPSGSPGRSSSRSCTPRRWIPRVDGGSHVLTASTTVVGRADHLLVRQPAAIRAQQLREEVHAATVTLRDALAHSLNVADRESRGDGGLRRGGGHGQPRRHELQDPADAGGGAGRLRNHAARSGGRVHDVRQRRRLHQAQLPFAWCARRTARWSTRTRWKRSRCSIRAWRT